MGCRTALPSRGEIASAVFLGGVLTLLIGGVNVSRDLETRKEFRAVSSFTNDAASLSAQRRAALKAFRSGEASKEQAEAARVARAEQQLERFRDELLAQEAEELDEAAPEGLAPEAQEELLHKMLSSNYRGGSRAGGHYSYGSGEDGHGDGSDDISGREEDERAAAQSSFTGTDGTTTR